MSREDVVKWLCKPETQAIAITPAMVEKWSEEIHGHYSEDWRHYHTMRHLSDMMNHFHAWRDKIADPASVILAILFHDIIYNPESSTNENDSVVIFKEFTRDIQLSDEVSQKVIQMITATIKHLPDDPSSVDSDLSFFLDFDMAILGQSEQEYDLYAANIQKEYCHMSPEDFCTGRTKVLQSFLARPRIYFTEQLYKVFEDQARQNMQREIELLQKPV